MTRQLARLQAGSVFCTQQIGPFVMIVASIDIFCHVIDNFGDAGVAYRFATEFSRIHHGCRVRVFIDAPAVLEAIDPSMASERSRQERGAVEFIDSSKLDGGSVAELGCAEVLVELFGCHTPACYLDVALFSTPLIINLEYLSAEPWGAGYHLKPSLLSTGTAKKFFYMPGFTTETGGLLFNTALSAERQLPGVHRTRWVNALLHRTGSDAVVAEDTFVGTIFTYERGFDTLITTLERSGRETLLLCFGRKSCSSMEQTLLRFGARGKAGLLRKFGAVTVAFLPNIPQHDYDRLLYCADFNLVRGEDSLVQAVCAARPFIWNAYLQDEKYQQVKVEAFCEEFGKYVDEPEVFASYRELMLQFNDSAIEDPRQITTESYDPFFRDLKKIEHATGKMSYFIRQNCNLVEKFSEFIRDF